MAKLKFFVATVFLLAGTSLSAQTLDVDALGVYHPSTVREVFAVSRYVKLDAAQQRALASAFEREDSVFVARVKADGGILSVKGNREVQKMHDRAIARVLDGEQLEQYYRGVFDKEADAEGIAVANRLQKKYGLTDQNWKFIRIAFYKIGLDSRVINKLMADQPAKARKKIETLRSEMLASIEAKGGIRVNPEGTTVTVVKPFDPNSLHKK
ncbi:MAG: hypothetical protein K2I39_09890 [Muribaculaceae bacterium]|nr:hypothetical protein [Muribaculaceae bacterium]